MKTFYLIFIAALLFVACNTRNSDKSTPKNVSHVKHEQKEVVFPKPKVPDLITAPEKRLAYVLDHFWSEYNFNDTTTANQTLAEQGFADFLAFLAHADSALIASSVKRYLDKGFAPLSLRPFHEALIRHYLHDPNSPMRNDDIYLHFLQAQLQYYGTPEEAERERCQFLMHMIKLNWPGTVATDFSFISHQGNSGTLHRIQSPYTLLVFSDPDCEHCMKELPSLLANPLLQHPALTVLMLNPESSKHLSTSVSLPESWIDAYNPEAEIQQHLLYYLPAMPSLYLLDAQKKVLLKDASLNQLNQTLSALLNQMPSHP